MSIDKAKMRRQTQSVSMNFVPAIWLGTDERQGETVYQQAQIKYKPEIRWYPGASSTIEQPTIRCGFIAFQGDGTMEGRHTQFVVKLDAWVMLKNQNYIWNQP